ncbi:MAG: hypothetical protein ACXADF_17820, partial [Candidatus Thorarchaeota archaeon]
SSNTRQAKRKCGLYVQQQDSPVRAKWRNSIDNQSHTQESGLDDGWKTALDASSGHSSFA